MLLKIVKQEELGNDNLIRIKVFKHKIQKQRNIFIAISIIEFILIGILYATR